MLTVLPLLHDSPALLAAEDGGGSGVVAIWVAVTGVGLVLVNLVLRLVAIGVIPEGRKPSSASAWLVLILGLPVLGSLLFWLLGRTDVGKVRRTRQADALAEVRQRAAGVGDPDLGPDAPPYLPSALRLNRNLGAFPAVPGGPVLLHTDYDESIAAMADLVGRARHRVHVEFYITTWDDTTDPLFSALAGAVRRGIEVRLLFDHLGSRGLPDFAGMQRRLDEAGIQWRAMLPLRVRDLRRPDLRNHRKLLVVDGEWAVTGSQNLTEPSYHQEKHRRVGRRWVELTATVEGPLARMLDGVFAMDWYTETGELLDEPPTAGRVDPDATWPAEAARAVVGQVVPSGPGVVAENNLRLFTALLYGATRRISITSPYFVPDESLLYAVTTAARRGVAVELFVGEEGDQMMVHRAQCSYYAALLEAGVRIWLYEPPLVLHAKHFSVDDDVAVLGSSNMDLRSFALNYEVSLLLTGPEVVAAMRRVEDGYRARSRELTLDEWTGRSRASRFTENTFRLTSALQ